MVALVVEGHGDCDAVPLLARRIAHERLDVYDVAVVVAVANREFEAWLLAGIPSLSAHPRAHGARRFDRPESVRAAKAALSDRLTEPYWETIHQASLSGSVSLAVCAADSRSFRHLESAVAALVRAVA